MALATTLEGSVGGWRIFAGAADEAKLDAFAQECGVTFEAASQRDAGG